MSTQPAAGPGRPNQPKLGDIRTWDFQSDVFGGEYRLVENLGGGRWMAERIEPSDAIIAAAEDYYFSANPESFAEMGYHDPFGPERRINTPQEAFDEEILRRIDDAGTRFEIRFVSSDMYNRHF